jgi:hypothetical protein
MGAQSYLRKLHHKIFGNDNSFFCMGGSKIAQNLFSLFSFVLFYYFCLYLFTFLCLYPTHSFIAIFNFIILF